MLNAYECITWFITTNWEQNNNECFPLPPKCERVQKETSTARVYRVVIWYNAHKRQKKKKIGEVYSKWKCPIAFALKSHWKIIHLFFSHFFFFSFFLRLSHKWDIWNIRYRTFSPSFIFWQGISKCSNWRWIVEFFFFCSFSRPRTQTNVRLTLQFSYANKKKKKTSANSVKYESFFFQPGNRRPGHQAPSSGIHTWTYIFELKLDFYKRTQFSWYYSFYNFEYALCFVLNVEIYGEKKK